MSRFAVVTDKGSIEFGPTSGNCVGCKAKGGGMVALTVHSTDEEHPVPITLCGDCIAVSLGTSVGSRALVSSLRRIKDLLTLPPDQRQQGDLEKLVDGALARWEGRE